MSGLVGVPPISVSPPEWVIIWTVSAWFGILAETVLTETLAGWSSNTLPSGFWPSQVVIYISVGTSRNLNSRYNQEQYMKGHLFETHRCCGVVSFKKTLYMSCLELVPSWYPRNVPIWLKDCWLMLNLQRRQKYISTLFEHSQLAK